jgi:hypothetical protein
MRPACQEAGEKKNKTLTAEIKQNPKQTPTEIKKEVIANDAQ